MKRCLVPWFAVVAMILASSELLQAQLDPVQRKAQIPFAFYVEDTQFPAGTYLVGWMGHRFHIQRMDGKQQASVLIVPVESRKTCERSVLQFSRYGEVRYLHAMWIAGRNTGHELLRTRTEMELAKKMTEDKEVMISLGPNKP